MGLKYRLPSKWSETCCIFSADRPVSTLNAGISRKTVNAKEKKNRDRFLSVIALYIRFTTSGQINVQTILCDPQQGRRAAAGTQDGNQQEEQKERSDENHILSERKLLCLRPTVSVH